VQIRLSGARVFAGSSPITVICGSQEKFWVNIRAPWRVRLNRYFSCLQGPERYRTSEEGWPHPRRAKGGGAICDSGIHFRLN